MLPSLFMLKINYICARYFLFAPLNPLSYPLFFLNRDFNSPGTNSAFVSSSSYLGFANRDCQHENRMNEERVREEGPMFISLAFSFKDFTSWPHAYCLFFHVLQTLSPLPPLVLWLVIPSSVHALSFVISLYHPTTPL